MVSVTELKGYEETFFGFLETIKSTIQRERTRDILERVERVRGEYMTRKEFVFSALRRGYTPKEVESRGKTEYRMDKDSSFFTMTKTEYRYACYLVSSGMTNPETAKQFIEQEQEAHRRKQQEEAERYLRQKQEEEENKRRREEERIRRMEQWTADAQATANRIITDELRLYLANTLSKHWQNLTGGFGGNIEQEQLYNNTFEKMCLQLGDASLTAQTAVSAFDQKNRNYGNAEPMFRRDMYGYIFKIREGDPAVAIRAKIKAYYEGREYRGKYK